MKKYLSTVVFFMLLSFPGSHDAYAPFTVYPCTIEFPKIVKKIPELCIYHGGERFVGEVDTTGRRSCFHLPIDRSCTSFTLLVTQDLQFESEKNTVQFLKIDPQQPYKYYSMQLIRASRRRFPGSQQQQEPDQWIIRPSRLSPDGRIPDETIILLMNPSYIDRVEGSNGFELPTLYIKDNVLDLAGSQQELLDQAVELVLSSLDYKPIHANLKTETRQDGEHLIIATAQA